MLNKTKEAQEKNKLADEKEKVKLAQTADLISNDGKNNTKSGLQMVLDKNEGINKTRVTRIGKDSYIVTFLNTNRNYKIEYGKEIEGPIKIEMIEDNNAGDISKGNTLDGSKEKPYQINCIEDLVDFSNKFGINNVNEKEIILTRDLDFLSELSYVDYKTTKYGDINKDGKVSELIEELTTGIGFKGINVSKVIFDGQNKRINNLYMNSDNTNIGFFLQIKNSTVKNLIINGDIRVNESGGGIIGKTSAKNYLYNLEFSGTIIEYNNILKTAVGGIVGEIDYNSNTEINKCRNKSNIEFYGIIGGIVGKNFGQIKVINCYNIGNLTTQPVRDKVYPSVGGILGAVEDNSNNIIANCYNTGKIENKGEGIYMGAGGIIGSGQRTTDIKIINCYNIGETTAKSAYIAPFSGGIQGAFWYSNYQSAITNCYYDGSKSERGVGGSKEEYAIKLTTTQIQGKEEIQNSDGTSSTLVELLNKGIDDNSASTDTNKWLRWKQGEQGYPIFDV